MPLHPRKRKTLKEQKIATKNSEALLSNFEFDPEEILDKILLSDLKKTSEKKIIDRLIENFPKENDQYYIEHRESTNSFQVRHNRNQKEKEDLFEFIFNADKKIARRKHKHSKS